MPAPARRRKSHAQPSTPSKQASSHQAPTEGERLQKVLAAAGVGSRRECEQLILDGRIEIDRRVVTELGVRVDPNRQKIRVDGAALPQPDLVYYVLNKPPGVVSTNRDPDGRPRVIDLIRTDKRLFSVGRLDRATEGLVLCTNDGSLAYCLTHPKFGVEKRYLVRVVGRPEWKSLSALREGIHLSDGFAKVTDLKIRKRQRNSTELEIVLSEGRNREIRRLLAKIGHKVVNLKRIAIGPLRLADLPIGAHRQLTYREVQSLRRYAAQITRNSRPRGGDRRPSKQTPSKPRGGQQRQAVARGKHKATSGRSRTTTTPRKTRR